MLSVLLEIAIRQSVLDNISQCPYDNYHKIIYKGVIVSGSADPNL